MIFQEPATWDTQKYPGSTPPAHQIDAEKGPQDTDKATAPGTEKVNTPQVSPEKETALRNEISSQMDYFDGQVVGNQRFDAIIPKGGKGGWDDKKAQEQKLREAGEKPAIYTTCIDTQIRILQRAFQATGLDAKKSEKAKDQLNFGTGGRANAKALGAWNEAKPNMSPSERPKPADVIILSKRGQKVDDAAQRVAYTQGVNKGEAGKGPTFKKIREAKKILASIKAKFPEAEVEAKMKSHAGYQKMSERLAKLQAKHKAEIELFEKKLEKARLTMHKTAASETGMSFSHTGFLKEIKPYQGPKSSEGGKEAWTTFDGGQTINGKQGALTSPEPRIYDPKTNEISGEASQGGAARWLAGWVDVSKLIQ